jgi:hypothetical protein
MDLLKYIHIYTWSGLDIFKLFISILNDLNIKRKNLNIRYTDGIKLLVI